MRLFLSVISLFLLLSIVYAGQYCIQVGSSNSLEKVENIYKNLESLSPPYLRIEKIGSYYVVKVGYFEDAERGKEWLNKIRVYYKDAFLRDCAKDESRIIKASYLSENSTSTKDSSAKNESIPITSGKVKITLKDLGFRKDILLQGAAPAYTFRIPVLEGLKDAKGVFYIEFSERIAKNSFVSILIDGVPKRFYKIQSNAIQVEVPIETKKSQDFVDITLIFSLYEPERICDYINDQYIYAIIRSDSYFELNTEEKEDTIKAFLLKYKPFLGVEGSLYDIANFSYFLAKTYRNLSLYTLDLHGDRRVSIGNYKGAYLKENTLFLDRNLLSAVEFPMLLDTGRIEKVEKSSQSKENKIPLSAFGYKTSTYNGFGTLTFTIPFYPPQGKPKKVLLYLKYGHTYIRDIDTGFLEVRVNDAIVFSEPIKESASVKERVVEIPSSALRFGENTLSILFRYYPGSDVCKGTVPLFSATLYDDSFFEFVGKDKDFASVYDFMVGIDGIIRLSAPKEVPYSIADFFKVMGYLNTNVVEFSGKEGDYAIVIEPYDKNKSFIVYDASTGQKVLEFKGDYDFLALSLENREGKPTLVISYTSPQALEYLKDITLEDIKKFRTNYVFITKDRIYPLEVGKKFRIEYSYPSQLELYLKKFRFVIIALVVFLISLLFWKFYRRLT